MDDMRKQIAKIMDSRKMTAEYQQMVQQAVNDEAVQQWLAANKAELAPDAVKRGAAKIYEYVTERDKIKNGQTPFAPGYQPELVVSNRLIDIAYEPTPAKIAADKQASQSSLVTAINLPKANQAATLANYDPTDRAEALNAALDFTVAMAQDPQSFHKGLYLTGPFGVGKTYLLGAIANDLAQSGIASTMVHFPTYTVELKDSISKGTVQRKVDQLRKAQVLMLDDIGAESFSKWIRDDVLGIILQYRMQEMKPTLFSSNKTMAELTAFLSGTEDGSEEELTGKRIMERVRFLATEIPVNGKDRRNS